MPRRLDIFTKRQSPALLNLSSLFSSARHTLRLFGLFSILTDTRRDFQYPTNSSLIDGINMFQVFTMASYQLLENIGHLASNKIISLEAIGIKAKAKRLYILAARALFLHFLLELIKLSKEAWLVRKGRKRAQSQMPPYPGNIRSEYRQSSSTESLDSGDNQNWSKRLWASSLWGVLCLYWSCGQTIPLVEEMAGGLGFLADFFTLRDTWIQTRK